MSDPLIKEERLFICRPTPDVSPHSLCRPTPEKRVHSQTYSQIYPTRFAWRHSTSTALLPGPRPLCMLPQLLVHDPHLRLPPNCPSPLILCAHPASLGISSTSAHRCLSTTLAHPLQFDSTSPLCTAPLRRTPPIHMRSSNSQHPSPNLPRLHWWSAFGLPGARWWGASLLVGPPTSDPAACLRNVKDDLVAQPYTNTNATGATHQQHQYPLNHRRRRQY